MDIAKLIRKYFEVEVYFYEVNDRPYKSTEEQRHQSRKDMYEAWEKINCEETRELIGNMKVTAGLREVHHDDVEEHFLKPLQLHEE